jgi:uncharacterized protein with von Willebrand factor type A (vWA) domain
MPLPSCARRAGRTDQTVEQLGELIARDVLEDLFAGARFEPAAAADEDVDAVNDLAVHLHLAPCRPTSAVW